MIRRKDTNKNSDRHFWYCGESAKHGKANCPHPKSIDEDVIKDCFVKAFNKLCNNSQSIVSDFMNNITKAIESKKTEQEMQEINKKINTAKGKQNQLVELLLNNKINDEIYKSKYDIFEDEIKEYQKQLDLLNADSKTRLNFNDRVKSFEKLFSNQESLQEFDDELFRTVVDRVIIGGYDETGTPLPYTINFIFKTGIEIKVRALFDEDEETLDSEETANIMENLNENHNQNPHENSHARRGNNNDDKGVNTDYKPLCRLFYKKIPNTRKCRFDR